MLKSIRVTFASCLIKLGLRLLPYSNEHVERELEIIEDNQLIPQPHEVSKSVLAHLKLNKVISDTYGSHSIVGYFVFRLLNGYPLSQLTGGADEWTQKTTPNGSILVSKRCKEIIRSPSSHTTWHTRAKLFEQEDGKLVQNFRSSQIVKFPFNVPDHPNIIRRK